MGSTVLGKSRLETDGQGIEKSASDAVAKKRPGLTVSASLYRVSSHLVLIANTVAGGVDWTLGSRSPYDKSTALTTLSDGRFSASWGASHWRCADAAASARRPHSRRTRGRHEAGRAQALYYPFGFSSTFHDHSHQQQSWIYHIAHELGTS